MLQFSDFFKINNSNNLFYKLNKMALLFESFDRAELLNWNMIPCPKDVEAAEKLINGGGKHRIKLTGSDGKPVQGWDQEFKKAAIVIIGLRTLALLGKSGHSVGSAVIDKDTPGYKSECNLAQLENILTSCWLDYCKNKANAMARANSDSITGSLMSSPADFALAMATKITRDTNRYHIAMDRESVDRTLRKLLIDDPDNFWKRIQP